MGFERRHRNDEPTREDLAEELARAHRLEVALARDVLRRAEQIAADDPEARPVRQWFAMLLGEDARGELVGKRTILEEPLVDRAAPLRDLAKPAPGRRTLVMRELLHDDGQVRVPAREAPKRAPHALDVVTQWRMSQALGFDFSGVSIRPDSPEATGSTRAVVKDGEIHFREGAYRPGTPEGDWLIAHELAHVVQQRGGRGSRAGSRRELEREADRAASLAMAGRSAPIALRAQPAAAYSFDEGEAHLERDEAVDLDELSSGDRLPRELQQRLSHALGADLSHVRVHLGERAASATEALHARAVTIGDDIYFAAGAYDPTSTAGIELIAHEVAHVVQHQRGGLVGERRVSHPADAHEQQAGAFATRFLTMREAPPQLEADPLASPRVAAGPSPRHAIDRSAAPHAGALWEQMFQGASTPVGKLGRVSAPLGIYLRAQPAAGAAKVSAIVPFNDQVYVERTTADAKLANRWAYVVATGAGKAGFIEERYLAIDPPEPTATLHRVTRGETLGGIAAKVYGASFSRGNDARLYVQALYEANKGRAGIHLDEVRLSFGDRVLHQEAEEETLKIYLGVKVIAGQALWIPSEMFIQQLQASGAITSGSTWLSKAWRTASSAVAGVAHGAEFLAGVVVGVLEGAYEAIRDIFKGAVELLKVAFEVVKATLTGQLLKLLIDTAHKVKEFFEHFSASKLIEAVGKYIADRWTNAGWFGKGEFAGEVVGYIAANVILVLLTEGGSLAAMLAEAAEAGSDLARAVMMLVKVTDAAQNPLKLLEGAGKGVTISEEAAAKLKQGLVKKTEQAGMEVESDLARGIEHGAGDAGNATKGPLSDKPKMTAEARSLDGLGSYTLEFMRDLSPTARMLVRKLEKQGWVKIEELAQQDLIQISKWFNREVAVVQSPYGRMRLVLGTEKRILKRHLKEGEVFVVHTHPVLRSHPDHFLIDLERAGKNVEAVIDWNGNITYYAKKGAEGQGKILNPIGHDGFVKPLVGYEAGFIDKEGMIVGFAKVDLVDTAAGTTVKVVQK